MAEHTGTRAPKGKPRSGGAAAARPASARRARGFAQAGALITTQLGTLKAKRGYAQARLIAHWPEIAGPELAAITHPVKLAPPRGMAGGLLTLAVTGAHAPQVQMQLPALRDRVNAALGPATVGRIQLTHTERPIYQRTPAPRPARPAQDSDLGPLRAPLSSIGDDDLRRALETLARNVLSRRDTSQD